MNNGVGIRTTMSHASELIRKCCSNARNLAKVAKSPWQQLHRERERKRERERERERWKVYGKSSTKGLEGYRTIV